MTPLNTLMNYSIQLAESDSYFKSGISSRVLMAAGGAPLEAVVAVHNAIKLPFETVLFCVKIPAKACALFITSNNLKDFADHLPGPGTIVATALKIVAYTLGATFTLTLGIISPTANFKLHTSLGLIRDFKAENARLRAEQERVEQQRAYEQQIQLYVDTIVSSLREKSDQAKLNPKSPEKNLAEPQTEDSASTPLSTPESPSQFWAAG